MRLCLLACMACLAATAQEPGFRSLFDGRTLTGWRNVDAKNGGYIVEVGHILLPSGRGGKLLSEEEFANFQLCLDYRIEAGGNNGINIRAPFEGRPAYVGMEIQILDDADPKWQKLRPEQYNGSIYDLIPARSGFGRKPGEWNEQEITAAGRRITVKLNGVIVLDISLDIVREPEILATHPGLARTSGHIGFLGHNTRSEFRNVRIKVLP